MHGHAKRILLLMCVAALASLSPSSTGLAQIRRNIPNTTQAVPLPLKALRVSAVEGTYTYGGNPVRGIVELNQPPGPSGVTVTLESSDPQLAGVPPSVTVTGGVTSAETGPMYTAAFPINTRPVQEDTTVIIRARVGAQTLQANLRIRRPVIKGASLNPPNICPGDGRVSYTITGPAPSGLKVSANVSGSNGGDGSGGETVPTGKTSGSFRIDLSRCNLHNPGQRCSLHGWVRVEGAGTNVNIGGSCGHPPD
jgi:hypothetical protein